MAKAPKPQNAGCMIAAVVMFVGILGWWWGDAAAELGGIRTHGDHGFPVP